MPLSKVQVQAIDKSLIETLTAFAKEHGLVFENAGGTFDENSFSKKVSFRLEGADSKELADLKEIAGIFKLDITKTPKININGFFGEVKLVGYKNRARKTPFIVENEKGSYRVEHSWVMDHWRDKDSEPLLKEGTVLVK